MTAVSAFGLTAVTLVFAVLRSDGRAAIGAGLLYNSCGRAWAGTEKDTEAMQGETVTHGQHNAVGHCGAFLTFRTPA